MKKYCVEFLVVSIGLIPFAFGGLDETVELIELADGKYMAHCEDGSSHVLNDRELKRDWVCELDLVYAKEVGFYRDLLTNVYGGVSRYISFDIDEQIGAQTGIYLVNGRDDALALITPFDERLLAPLSKRQKEELIKVFKQLGLSFHKRPLPARQDLDSELPEEAAQFIERIIDGWKLTRKKSMKEFFSSRFEVQKNFGDQSVDVIDHREGNVFSFSLAKSEKVFLRRLHRLGVALPLSHEDLDVTFSTDHPVGAEAIKANYIQWFGEYLASRHRRQELRKKLEKSYQFMPFLNRSVVLLGPKMDGMGGFGREQVEVVLDFQSKMERDQFIVVLKKLFHRPLKYINPSLERKLDELDFVLEDEQSKKRLEKFHAKFVSWNGREWLLNNLKNFSVVYHPVLFKMSLSIDGGPPIDLKFAVCEDYEYYFALLKRFGLENSTAAVPPPYLSRAWPDVNGITGRSGLGRFDQIISKAFNESIEQRQRLLDVTSKLHYVVSRKSVFLVGGPFRKFARAKFSFRSDKDAAHFAKKHLASYLKMQRLESLDEIEDNFPKLRPGMFKIFTQPYNHFASAFQVTALFNDLIESYIEGSDAFNKYSFASLKNPHIWVEQNRRLYRFEHKTTRQGAFAEFLPVNGLVVFSDEFPQGLEIVWFHTGARVNSLLSIFKGLKVSPIERDFVSKNWPFPLSMYASGDLTSRVRMPQLGKTHGRLNRPWSLYANNWHQQWREVIEYLRKTWNFRDGLPRTPLVEVWATSYNFRDRYGITNTVRGYCINPIKGSKAQDLPRPKKIRYCGQSDGRFMGTFQNSKKMLPNLVKAFVETGIGVLVEK